MNAYAVRHGFRVPDGFEVSLYAGDDLVHDIFSMTTDGDGVADGEHSAKRHREGAGRLVLPDLWQRRRHLQRTREAPRLVQTGPDTTVRLTGDEVTSVVDTRVSLMPTGLLNCLKDAEVADFYAFLKTLRK